MENQHINESILSEEILEDQKKNRIDHMKYMPGMEDIGSEILDQVVDAMHAYDYDKYTGDDIFWKQIQTASIRKSRLVYVPDTLC